MFKIGDKVRLVDDILQGVVIHVISSGKVLVEDEHGFQSEYSNDKVVKVKEREDSQLLNAEIKHKDEYIFDKKNKANNSLISFLEIDLHIHELRDDHANLSNFEILSIQIQALKRKIKEANKKRVKRLIVIHGVGKGVLKSEVHLELQKYHNIEFLDASYLDYGQGATQVIFNWFE